MRQKKRSDKSINQSIKRYLPPTSGIWNLKDLIYQNTLREIDTTALHNIASMTNFSQEKEIEGKERGIHTKVVVVLKTTDAYYIPYISTRTAF